MGKPAHPETVIVKNDYYPHGLTEDRVWNYFDKNRDRIIKELNNRNSLLLIIPKLNDIVFRRFVKDKKIILTKENYDKLIHGRVISISVEREDPIDYICVDVDPGEAVKEKETKDLIKNKLLTSGLKSLSTHHRISNSATGYHVYFYLKEKMGLEEGYQILTKQLIMIVDDRIYLGAEIPPSDKIKLDTVSTRNGGSHTVIGSLCKNGLICKDITYELDNFTRRSVLI